ncbi:MAG: SIMPL domain-containing protein [Spirochaetota bacterium]
MGKLGTGLSEAAKYLVLGIAIVAAVAIGTGGFIRRNAESQVISVTGMGTADFKSDLIVWSGSFTQLSRDMKDSYARLSADQAKIKEFLAREGVPEENTTFSSVSIVKEYSYTTDKEGVQHSEFVGYRLEQRITIESGEIEKIEAVSRKITDLINSGVEFYSNPPEYYYTKLSELKIELIERATRNAKERAEIIARNAGQKLGALKYATMGVFQIIAQNSNEDFSWDGAFNTDAKMKTATITMKLQFGIR